jgi:hypothetical protein
MADLVQLVSVPTEFEADLIKQKLAEAGIESFRKSEGPEHVYPSVDYVTGIDLFVLPEDFEKASWLVTNTEDDLQDDMEVGGGD